MSTKKRLSKHKSIRLKPILPKEEYEGYLKALTKLNLNKVNSDEFPIYMFKRFSKLNEVKQNLFIKLLVRMQGDMSYPELYQKKYNDIERLLCAFGRLDITASDVRQIILPVEIYGLYIALPLRKQEQFVRYAVERHKTWANCGQEYVALREYVHWLLHQQEVTITCVRSKPL